MVLAVVDRVVAVQEVVSMRILLLIVLLLLFLFLLMLFVSCCIRMFKWYINLFFNVIISYLVIYMLERILFYIPCFVNLSLVF